MSSETDFRDLTVPLFRRIIAALTLLFLAIETFCILRFPLIMDEFVDATVVWRMVSKVPYRDLPLSKTVLGYYLQLPVLLSAGDAWCAILAVKFEMALLSAAAIVYAALTIARDFSRAAVALAFMLLVTMSTFYERAAEFRSDMPTAIAGLIALLCLVRRRPAWAGFWCGVSLMMSQKGAYYVLASEAALLLALSAFRRREELRDLVAFNVGAIATFGAYLLFWTALSSPQAVFYDTFVAQQTNAFGTHFTNIRWTFWSQTLRRNPVYYTVAAAALAFLGRRAFTRRDEMSLLLCSYGAFLSALCIWHKQPWPYFFVMLVPLLFVIQVPLLDYALRTGSRSRQRAIAALVVVAAFAAIATRLPATLPRDSGFQRSMFRLGERILLDGGTYFAAVPIFYRHRQAAEKHMESVDTVQREYLLRLTPTELLEIVRELDRERPRFIVFNYRIDGLPVVVRQYLVATFEPYWGAIFIYAPKVRSGPFAIHFDGDYVVETDVHEDVFIDGRGYPAGSTVRLTRGRHDARSSGIFRLRLEPANVRPYLDPRCQNLEEFFPAVYVF